MKQLPIRNVATVLPYLTEATEITHDGRVIGIFKPLSGGRGWIDLGENVTQEEFEEVKRQMHKNVRPAIEKEQVKQQPDGKLSKGLGELPGEDRPMVEGVGPWTGRPAPKPAPKK